MQDKLVIFDFDGTLTNRDSMLAFTRFYHGPIRYYLGMLYLLPILLAYKTGTIPNWRAKTYFLTHFFGKEPLQKFQEKCDRFAMGKVPLMLRPAAIRKLTEHQLSGDRVIVVSSSAENWLQAWCDRQEVELIGARLEVRDGRLTGKLQGENCYGPEKVRRLKAHLSVESYAEVIVYGDSKGDFALFEIASDYFYQPFRKRPT